MTEGVLGLVGLGMRAGSVVVGINGVRAALKRGELRLVMVAGDSSERTGDKVVRLARARGIPLVEGPSAAVMGQSLGRGEVQAIGVRDHRLAAGIEARAAGEGR